MQASFLFPALLAGMLPMAGSAQDAAERGRLAFSLGSIVSGSEEAYLRYESASGPGPFRYVFGASLSGDEQFWAGAGLLYHWERASSPFFAQASVQPGVFSEGEGFDLGGSFQIRSEIGLGYQLPGALRVSLSYDHRSNAGFNNDNPGLDSVHLRLSLPLP